MDQKDVYGQKVFLDTVGCRLNQSEIEVYARHLKAAGHMLVDSPDQADLVIINTCTVTSKAASDSRQKIRQAARAGAPRIAVTGCWSTLEPSYAAGMANVQWVIPNENKATLIANILELPEEIFDLEPIVRESVPGSRLRTRAFIKVQDGCNNRCTFCITTIARGSSRSLPTNEVVREIRAAEADGVQEVVLTGVHMGAWGADLQPSHHLSDLIKNVLQGTDIPRIRLSSIEPWDLDADFFDLWENPRLCRHLHLPLQSGSHTTLHRMGRKTTPQDYKQLTNLARSVCPEIAITTDVITGFPGESEDEFLESLAFVQEIEFAGGHVFPYNERAGTVAAKMPDQITHAIRKERSKKMRSLLKESAQRYRQNFVGKHMPVLWESAVETTPDHWQLSGITDNYLRVYAQYTHDVHNQITGVRMTRCSPAGMHAEFAMTEVSTHSIYP